MKNFVNKKVSLLLFIIISLFIAGYIFTDYSEKREIVDMKETKTQYLIDGVFHEKVLSFEDTFKRMYEAARTISLLPGVRGIEGDNLKSEDEDIIKDGRLSQESYDTIQQLYNNLAFNVPVSEIYIVNDGLDFKAGQTPFLMMDQLIIRNTNEEQGEEGEVNHDFPEESEEEEYIHYPKQISELKKLKPIFDFEQLDDIPALTSEVVRTCDNTQYLSKTSGNVDDAGGILYSVPFYNLNDKLKGIISVVFRTNILEAKLIDVPFVIITDEDKEEAKKLGFTMPKEPSNFILYNQKHNVFIYDRRNPALKDMVKKYPKGNDKNFFVEDLNIKSESKWQLFYYIDDKNFVAETQKIKSANMERIIFLFILAFLAISTIFWNRCKELSNRKELEEFANVINHMTDDSENKKVNIDKDNDVYIVAEAFNNYLEHIKNGLEKDIQTINNITQVADEVSNGLLKSKITKEPSNPQLIKAKESINNMLERLETLIGSDINKIVETLESYSNYDFSSQLQTQTNGNIETITKKLGLMVSEMLKTNYENSLNIKKNAKILEKNVNILNENSSNQTASLEEISTSIVQITSIVENNNSRINSMMNLRNELESLANSGKELANNSGISMDEINEQTNAIAEAITVIDQIAFQTNILSLNAAVEAATAGEAGKGFAVVAQEVRNLAGKSAEAAKKIKDLVDLATQKTQLGKENSQNMIEGYKELSQSIEKTTSIINEISQASNEEKNGILLINSNIKELDIATQENSQSAIKTKEIAINSTNMARQVVKDVNKTNFIGKEES